MLRILLFMTCFLVAPLLAAAEQDDAVAATDAAMDEAASDAMKRLTKAPDIDFENLRDPFASYLALVAQRGRAALIERQSRLESRPREALENFDLSTLKLVAIFSMGEERVAMIEDATGKGYVVRRGNYMGKNNGRIEKISEDTVYLVEQVLNPAGEITDQQVTLTLKEVNP